MKRPICSCSDCRYNEIDEEDGEAYCSIDKSRTIIDAPCNDFRPIKMAEEIEEERIARKSW